MSPQSKLSQKAAGKSAGGEPSACVGFEQTRAALARETFHHAFIQPRANHMTTLSKIADAAEPSPLVAMVWILTIGLFLSAGLMAALMV